VSARKVVEAYREGWAAAMREAITILSTADRKSDHPLPDAILSLTRHYYDGLRSLGEDVAQAHDPSTGGRS